MRKTPKKKLPAKNITKGGLPLDMAESFYEFMDALKRGRANARQQHVAHICIKHHLDRSTAMENAICEAIVILKRHAPPF